MANWQARRVVTWNEKMFALIGQLAGELSRNTCIACCCTGIDLPTYIVAALRHQFMTKMSSEVVRKGIWTKSTKLQQI